MRRCRLWRLMLAPCNRWKNLMVVRSLSRSQELSENTCKHQAKTADFQHIKLPLVFTPISGCLEMLRCRSRRPRWRAFATQKIFCPGRGSQFIMYTGFCKKETGVWHWGLGRIVPHINLGAARWPRLKHLGRNLFANKLGCSVYFFLNFRDFHFQHLKILDSPSLPEALTFVGPKSSPCLDPQTRVSRAALSWPRNVLKKMKASS